MQEFLTVLEAAERSRMSKQLVYRLFELGILEGYKAGVPDSKKKAIFIRAASVDAYIAANSNTKTETTTLKGAVSPPPKRRRRQKQDHAYRFLPIENFPAAAAN